MLLSTLLALTALSTGANAHFRLLEPIWRGSSFDAPASQYIYPCANVNETTDAANRTQWPTTGGSLIINGSHAHAFTYVNLALGSNATNFNITLLPVFNQTGAGIFCTKETGKSQLDAAFKAAGYSGTGDQRLEGMLASVQVVQLGTRGSALYNCADIVFNSSATPLGDDTCKNGTGVGGVALESEGKAAGSGNATAETTKPNAAASVVSLFLISTSPILYNSPPYTYSTVQVHSATREAIAMPDCTSSTMDRSLFGSESESESASDIIDLDVVALYQEALQWHRTQVPCNQEAADDMIDDYLESGDALLVREGERMRAAEEGRKVVDERSGTFG
ncbi:hypothetical protein A1F97_09990, partial [Pyrenophora tritici-repentis]